MPLNMGVGIMFNSNSIWMLHTLGPTSIYKQVEAAHSEVQSLVPYSLSFINLHHTNQNGFLWKIPPTIPAAVTSW